MDEKQFQELVDKVGKEAAEKIKKEFEAYKETVKEIANKCVEQKGYITEEQFKKQQDAADKALNEIKQIAKEQGQSINSLMEKITNPGAGKGKSIEKLLKENEGELKKIYDARSGSMEFLLEQKANGEFVMRKFDARSATKAAGPTATIDDVDDGANVASIAQGANAASLLRVGGSSPIVSQYRNSPWIFDLVNVTTSEYVSGMPVVFWYEEVATEGAANIVVEGATKPKVQYKYVLKSANYKKVAHLVQFTEEFSIDFRRLQDDILNKGRIDLLNVVNNDVLADLITKATTYNTSASFGAVPFANDFDVIAAMAAQVDNATLGNSANTAIMSTFKKYKMGVTKDEFGAYLNRPDVLSTIQFVGNPDMAADQVVVGDLRQYNIILRGGIIVRIGYVGNDFAENKFSVVMEQFYWNYISEIRRAALVKGPDFATVKDLINDSVSA